MLQIKAGSRIGWILLFFLLLQCDRQTHEAEAETREAFLWKIEGEPPSYLFGTVHLPDSRVLRIPAHVEQVFASVDAFFSELEMDPEAMATGFRSFLLPESVTLRDVLPVDLYADIERYLEGKGSSIDTIQPYKVFYVQLRLSLLDYLEEMRRTPAMDAQLYERAQVAGKEVGGVETFDEQVSAFETLTVEEQIHSLRKGLSRLVEAEEEGMPLTEQLVRVYLSGDPLELEDFFAQQVDAEDPVDQKFLEALLFQRNTRMADRVAQLLQKNPGKSYLFAFGAGHMPGRRGVAQLLRDQGFDISLLGASGEPRQEEARSGAGAVFSR